MLLRKRLWIILALCFAVFFWKIFSSWDLGHLFSVNDLEEWSQMKPCSYKRCPNLSNLDWFCERFDVSIKLLLNPENVNIPPDGLMWWMKLQQSHGESEFKAIVKRISAILPSINRNQAVAHCGTCAVVGNSGRLKGSKYGEKIDSHYYVLRMNNAKTAGFEEDVGTRTTHHFMYPESAVDLRPDVCLMLVPFKLMDLKWLVSAFSSGDVQHTYERVKRFIKADKDKVFILSPVFLKYIHDKWVMCHGRYPSTGIIALMFALHSCTQVSAFGFGADNNGNWHHYWETNRYAGAFRKTGVHDAIAELALIEKLATEGKIVFYK